MHIPLVTFQWLGQVQGPYYDYDYDYGLFLRLGRHFTVRLIRLFSTWCEENSTRLQL